MLILSNLIILMHFFHLTSKALGFTINIEFKIIQKNDTMKNSDEFTNRFEIKFNEQTSFLNTTDSKNLSENQTLVTKLREFFQTTKSPIYHLKNKTITDLK